jgi:hypothetical protein
MNTKPTLDQRYPNTFVKMDEHMEIRKELVELKASISKALKIAEKNDTPVEELIWRHGSAGCGSDLPQTWRDYAKELEAALAKATDGPSQDI